MLSKIYDHSTNKAFVKKSELKRLKMYRSNSAERIKDPRSSVDSRSNAEKRRAQNRMLQQHMDRANKSMIENLEDEEVERLLNEMSNLKDSLGPDDGGSILTTENDSRPRTSRGGSRLTAKPLEQPKKANFSHRGRGPEHGAQLQMQQREAFTNSPTPGKHTSNRGPAVDRFDVFDRRNSPEVEDRRAVPRPQSAKLKKRKA